METRRSGGCAVCGRSLPASPVERDGRAFCCEGCASVREAFGPGDDAGADTPAGDDGDDEATGNDAATGTDDTGDGDVLPPDHVETFLGVDGMHTATCEVFLESVAESQAGVAAADASYVTETVRVVHDPEQTPPDALDDALSTLGYDASLRDAAGGADGGGTAGDSSHAAAGPGDPDNTTGPGGPDDGVDEMLGFRYVAGVVFGSFVLLPYVVVLYPAHLAALAGAALPAGFPGADVGGGNLVTVLPVFLVLTSVVLFFTGAPLLRGAYVSLRTRRPNADLLVATTVVAAYVYSTVALAAGRVDAYYDLTIVVAAGVVAAILYESQTKRRAAARLTDLTASQVEEATRYRDDGTTETVDVGDLSPGDRLLVRRGERVPVDGTLDEGDCTVDESVVTGESLPVAKHAGDDLVGGAVVTDDAAVLRVAASAASSIERLTEAVWRRQSADHGVQRRADALAGVVVPLIAGGAVVVGAVSLALGASPVAAVLAALAVPIAASPWALGFSTPLSVATSVAAAVRRGVVVFDETTFERLRETDVVAFDKTGTLTTGEMTVVDSDAPPALLDAAAALERRATHPAAEAIVDAFGSEERGDAARDDAARADGGERQGVADERNGESEGEHDRKSGGEREDDPEDWEPADDVTEFQNHGTGVGGTVDVRQSEALTAQPEPHSGSGDSAEVLVGAPELFADRGWAVDDEIATRAAEARRAGRLPVLVGRDGRAEGVVVVGDEPRPGWEATVADLGERGVDVVVLTGDSEAAAEPFREHSGVDQVVAGVPPEGKAAAVRRLAERGHVTMVGDGTNDAPALAAADLGVALGGGTALAADAADVALVEDDLGAVETAFDVASGARRRLRQNTALALVYNGVAIPAALAGLLNPLVAVGAAAACGGLVAANAGRDLVSGEE